MSDAFHDLILDDSLVLRDINITINIYEFIFERRGQEFEINKIFNYLSGKGISFKNRKQEILNFLKFLTDLGFLDFTLLDSKFKVSGRNWR